MAPQPGAAGLHSVLGRPKIVVGSEVTIGPTGLCGPHLLVPEALGRASAGLLLTLAR